MNIQAMQPGNLRETDAKTMEILSSPAPTATPTPIQPKPTARVSVEIPADPGFNPFDPNWVKLWEHVGPISYLVLLCLLVWLLTRLVEVVKGK
ncbi:hypothetical protein [Leptothermofonsia sp. ETS-13]|uniref:hypothetical protein n=1 Tax=Leptothermofonsia sp. ETS-13 TaxID=3035696 RepID=UPI003B9E1E0E